MSVKKTAEAIVKAVRKLIRNAEFQMKVKRKEEDFTRKRKLGFAEYMMLILQTSKKSLQVMLNTFCDEYTEQTLEYSKQAFSKGRERILPKAIEEIYRVSVGEFYGTADYKTICGYRVSAIDGTIYNMPKTQELQDFFGSQKSTGGMVQARSSCLYDVVNHIIMDAAIDRIDSSERDLAKAHIEMLKTISTGKELLLFDRGYPSEKLIHEIEDAGFKYVMRCTKDRFFKEIRDFSGSDGTVMRKSGKKYQYLPINFRIVCIKLDPNGDNSEQNVVTLITNLNEAEFPEHAMLELYRLRWGIETKYNEIKNKLMVESFSGVSLTAVLQDFWASMFMTNLASAFEFDANALFSQTHGAETVYFQKQINRATIIASLRMEFLAIFLEESDRKRADLFKKFTRRFARSLTCIYPDRHFPRPHCNSVKSHPKNVKSLS